MDCYDHPYRRFAGCRARFMRRALERGFTRGFAGPPRQWSRGLGNRPFEQGDLRWLVLDLISEQARHGYDIIKVIGEKMEGEYSPSPGVIYPTLTFLEESGMIRGEMQGSKKLFAITDEGRTELGAHQGEVEAAKSRLDEARRRMGGAPPPELIRAMGNLWTAMRIRLSKGKLSPEQIKALAAVIDKAATAVQDS